MVELNVQENQCFLSAAANTANEDAVLRHIYLCQTSSPGTGAGSEPAGHLKSS